MKDFKQDAVETTDKAGQLLSGLTRLRAVVNEWRQQIRAAVNEPDIVDVLHCDDKLS